ncbi:hypothetical protein NIES2107_71580 (plasmid) [Nostoc carneum NIES-2107]|nr:hypothetical protein NIES2107_71580 [Nostoc carneum NIES-2107]
MGMADGAPKVVTKKWVINIRNTYFIIPMVQGDFHLSTTQYQGLYRIYFLSYLFKKINENLLVSSHDFKTWLEVQY